MVFMEWLFFATKPSFMSTLGLLEKIQLYFLSAFMVAGPVLVLLTLLAALLFLIPEAFHGGVLFKIGLLLPSTFAATSFILVLDNFTYTVLNFGIVSSRGMVRILYGFLLLVSYLRIYQYLRNGFVRANVAGSLSTAFLAPAALGLVGISALLWVVRFGNNPIKAEGPSIGPEHGIAKPNVLLIGSDGLSASHMSIYGYRRNTTPTMDALKDSFVVAENAFTNAGNSGGSIASIYTGKLPTETGVIYPPDILTGLDAYRHLPGILKRLGYSNYDFSVPHFGDAMSLNVREGFDFVNAVKAPDQLDALSLMPGLGYEEYFISSVFQRIRERVLHILLIKDMINPYDSVKEGVGRLKDREIVNEVTQLFSQVNEPLFVHVHLMGTHGPRFHLSIRNFSKGLGQEESWQDEFYDDAVLRFDTFLGEIMGQLAFHEVLNNTIIVVYTDHPMQWQTRERIPLLIRFPRGEYARRISNNVQNLDIGPTILEYIGVNQPEWMGGTSIMMQDPPEARKIISESTTGSLIIQREDEGWVINTDVVEPPFYQLGYVGEILCDRWFELHLVEPSLTFGHVVGSTSFCSDLYHIGPDEIRRDLLIHLTDNGYNVSGLEEKLSE
jgi:hypothetical protein